MSAKALGTFVGGLAVGAGLMWLLGPQGAAVAVAPDAQPSLGGAEVAPDVPAVAAEAEPAPLPKPPPVDPGEHLSEEEWEAKRKAAAEADSRPLEIAPGDSTANGGGVKVLKGGVPKGAGKSSTLVFGDGGTFKVRMLKSPEEVYGKALVAAAKTADNSSPEFLEAFAKLLAGIGSGEPEQVHAARQLLDDLIAKGRLAPHQLAQIESRFDAAEPGSTERNQFAAMLARAKAGDPGVANFLDRIDRAGDVEAARAALHAPEHPNRLDPAVDVWRRKLIAESPSESLLQDVLSPQRMGAWLTRQNGAAYVSAVQERLQRGDLSTKLRGQALRSLATAGIHAPEAAAAVLQTAAQSDAEPKLAAFAKEAGELVRTGAANPASLQKAWYQQYPPSETSVSGATIILEGELPADSGDGDEKK